MNNVLSKKVIDKIKSEGIIPRPRWHFLLKRWILWLLAIVATGVGGLAVSIILFSFVDHDESSRLFLEESPVEDFLLTIPYLWLILLAVLTGVTQYAVRHAKFGYRYTTMRIILFVLVGSFCIGAALNILDIGEKIQNFFEQTVPFYNELTYTNKDSWSQPEKGLLGGMVVKRIDDEKFELIDFHQQTWLIDIGGLPSIDKQTAKAGDLIKIVGSIVQPLRFEAKELFPWGD